jgi:hypothetical protein
MSEKVFDVVASLREKYPKASDRELTKRFVDLVKHDATGELLESLARATIDEFYAEEFAAGREPLIKKPS